MFKVKSIWSHVIVFSTETPPLTQLAQNFFWFHNIPIILSAFYLIATYIADNKIGILIGISTK